MKKKGYTLAETLVAMGVIGVVAALMLPLMNKYKPDAEKALFIRTYDSVVEAVSTLVSNNGVYPHEYTLWDEPEGCEVDNECNYWDFSQAPLLNAEKVVVDGNVEIGIDGNNQQAKILQKFCNAMAYQMHTDNLACHIELVNGVGMHINGYQQNGYYFPIQIGIPSKGGHKSHTILVFANGHVIPGYDNLETVEYLMTRGNWKKGKSLDKKIVTDEARNYQKIFNYWRAEMPKQIKKYKFDGTEITNATYP